MTEPLLSIQDLHIEFRTTQGRVRALNGISFDIYPGEVFGVVGETGSGKTVTGLSVLKLLSRSAKVTRGRILFNGVDLVSLSDRQMQRVRGREIAMIFQDPASSLNPVFSIGEQLTRVIRRHLGFSQTQAHNHAAEMLEAVGLPDPNRILQSYPHQLSGGMQQRAMIALALSCRPSLLIADEPTTALDVTIQAQILALLLDLQKQFGIAVQLITHNLGIVANSCDRLAVLYAGRVVESGTTEAIFATPQHPYTRGLLAAVPSPSTRGKELVAIPGSVPSDPGAVVGCAFALRCSHAFRRCLSEPPALIQIDEHHISACFLNEIDERERVKA